MTHIKINGNVIDVGFGNCNIVSRNGKISVNGKNIELGDCKDITIVGNVGKIEADGRVEVHGYVEGDVDAGGSVTCKDINGNISAGGSVKTGGKVSGDISAGGSVKVYK